MGICNDIAAVPNFSSRVSIFFFPYYYFADLASHGQSIPATLHRQSRSRKERIPGMEGTNESTR